ncbi:hypothetical protein CRE_14957 [Caenorhabditis remanei]|uniref:Uncharacterized protein n=1 Tax=Caenorhabditis remanei TaxID=31234 RepID=E3NBX3_CAERE|nr:hypothetical protein CRE_14957 [Caenorhabditis remanei]
MLIYFEINSKYSNLTSGQDTLEIYSKAISSTCYHLVASLLFIVYYAKIIIQNETHKFEFYRPFHGLMYLSIVSISSLICYSIYKPYSWSMHFLPSSIFIAFQYFIFLSILIFQLSIFVFGLEDGNLKKLACIVAVALALLQWATHKVLLIIETPNYTLKYYILDPIFLLIALIFTGILFKKLVKGNLSINQQILCILINSVVSVVFLVGIQIWTIEGPTLAPQPQKLFEENEYIFCAFYIPFLWILSANLSYSDYFQSIFQKEEGMKYKSEDERRIATVSRIF